MNLNDLAPNPVPNPGSPEPVPAPRPIFGEANTATPTSPATPAEVIVGAPTRPGDKEEAATAPAAASPAPTTPTPINPAQPATGLRPDGTELDKGEKTLAGIGYIGLFFLVPLLLRTDSEYCQHHGRQGLVLTLGFTLIEVLFRIFGGVLHALVVLAMLATWIIGFVLAFQGQWFRVPQVYEFSTQLTLHPQKRKEDEEDEIKPNS